jgi:hypothetical protein
MLGSKCDERVTKVHGRLSLVGWLAGCAVSAVVEQKLGGVRNTMGKRSLPNYGLSLLPYYCTVLYCTLRLTNQPCTCNQLASRGARIALLRLQYCLVSTAAPEACRHDKTHPHTRTFSDPRRRAVMEKTSGQCKRTFRQPTNTPQLHPMASNDTHYRHRLFGA